MTLSRSLLVLLSFAFFLASCKHEDTRSSKPSSEIAVSTIESKVLTEKDNEVLQIIKSGFDSVLHISNTHQRPLVELYQFNSAGLTSTFLKREPISINFPYDNKLRLSDYDNILRDSDIWSYKCGYADSSDVMITNFYCLNTSGPFFDYLKNISPSNGIIEYFISDYLRYQDFSPGIQQEILTRGRDDLDFTNTDHQMFWAIYHLSLNETMNAQKVANAFRQRSVRDKQ